MNSVRVLVFVLALLVAAACSTAPRTAAGWQRYYEERIAFHRARGLSEGDAIARARLDGEAVRNADELRLSRARAYYAWQSAQPRYQSSAPATRYGYAPAYRLERNGMGALQLTPRGYNPGLAPAIPIRSY